MRKLDEKKIKSLLPVGVTIDFSTYKNNKTKARFIHEIHGEWWTLPCNVLNKKSSHPATSIEKQKNTTVNRYGVENAMKLESIKQKIRETNQKLRGVDYPTQSNEVRSKVKKTMMDRYGVEHNSQTPQYRESFRKTMEERYGVCNPSQIPSVKQKVALFRENNKTSESLPEKEIREFLESLGFTNISKRYVTFEGINYEIDLKPQGADFGIEYHGLYWHSEAILGNKARCYHENKMKAAQAHGIRLFQIFGHEWSNRKDQIKSFLRAALGKNLNKIGARSCEIKQINNEEAYVFFDKFHIQGNPFSSILNLGIFYKQDLVAVASFSLHPRDSKKITLSRWCCKENWTISGALSKISTEALKILNIDQIITWSDNRWSIGNGYEAAGWVKQQSLDPDYFYTDGNDRVISKQSRRKRACKTPNDITESQHAKADGLYRVWDAGKIRYVLMSKEVSNVF